MTIQERFLLLFSNYRELRDREQRSTEEALHFRTLYEEAQNKLDAAQKDALSREREMNDRIMNARVASQATIRQVPPPIKVQLTPQEWKRQQTQKFREDLEARKRQLMGQDANKTA